jgi:hypothetical protein
MAKSAEYRDEYTFIKTPESESDLELILYDSEDKKQDTLSETSTHSTMTFSNNFEKKEPSTPDADSESITYLSCDSSDIPQKKHDVIFDLKSKNILFSDITGYCASIYFHYTLNELLTEHISIIGCLLNTSRYWIYDMIVSALQTRCVKSIPMRELLKSKREMSKNLTKGQIIEEIFDKKINSLKKPTCWKRESFLKYIKKYFNMNKIMKVDNIYYIMNSDMKNNNYIIAKCILQKNDIIISCINSLIIGEIYADILLNGICFSGWNSLCL